jgi:hypothetical protein
VNAAYAESERSDTRGLPGGIRKPLNMRLNAYCRTFERGRIQCLLAGFDAGLYAVAGFGSCPSVAMRGSRKDLWTG